MTRAVVFAYHNVGVRCLSVLLAHGVEVPLLLTHRDNPDETIWFDSVAGLAALHDIPTITPDDPNAADIAARIAALQPDFIFSFYYRQMLKPALLALPRLGAYNMHGSLLPKYRGRVPVNWAVIRGERETGATLHRMLEKPDAGAIVAQQAVPILPDDTALAVFNKVTVAAEIALDQVLPQLVAGTAPQLAQDLGRGSYFGGRKPEDGRIDWNDTAETVHNLVRGVAPPYPGAFTDVAGRRLRILKTLRQPGRPARHDRPSLYVEEGRCYAQCADGGVLRIVEVEIDGKLASPAEIERQFAPSPIPLSTTCLSAS
jgi:methionyl-tRNA formyltransferase